MTIVAAFIVVGLSTGVTIGLGFYRAFIIWCAIHWYFPEYDGIFSVTKIWAALMIFTLIKAKFMSNEEVDENNGLRSAKKLGWYLLGLTMCWGSLWLVRYV